MERTPINTRKKYLVKKINNFICCHCKIKKISEELEIDHIIPISNGGTNDYSNLQCLCIDCHLKKSKGEWEEGYGIENNVELTPEESLDILKDYLDSNRDRTYPEIQFLVLNHKILSRFNYNSTTLGLMYRQVKGIKDKVYKNEKLINIRDKLIYILKNEKTIKRKDRLSYRDMEKIFKKYGFNISCVQIRNICSKIDNKNNEKKEETEKIEE